MSTYAVGFGDGGQVMVDTKRDVLVINRKRAQNADLKLSSLFDIIALRDLLNDAYPPGVVGRGPDLRMRSKG